MGSCLSLDQEELKARARSDNIDKQLQTWARQEENCIKILLLGKLTYRKFLNHYINNSAQFTAVKMTLFR